MTTFRRFFRWRTPPPAPIAAALGLAWFASTLAATEPLLLGFERIGELAPGETLEAAHKHLQTGEYARAVLLAEESIERIETTLSRYDVTLAEAMVVLGDARAALGDFSGALTAYDQARYVTRVNLGLYAREQVDIVYREAAVFVTMDDFAKANDREEYAYQLLRRSNVATPDVVEATLRLARWYEDADHPFAARELYEQAMDLAAANLPPGHSLHVEALRRFAHTYRIMAFPPGSPPGKQQSILPKPYANYIERDDMPATGMFQPAAWTVRPKYKGEQALIAASVLVGQAPDSSGVDSSEVLLELGDWFLLFRKHREARETYKRVWTMLGKDVEARDRAFAKPKLLYTPWIGNPDQRRARVSEETGPGLIELSISVNVYGKVHSVEVVRSEPEIFDIKVSRLTRLARYRPAFVEGAPVGTDNVQVIHRFEYFLPM